MTATPLFEGQTPSGRIIRQLQGKKTHGLGGQLRGALQQLTNGGRPQEGQLVEGAQGKHRQDVHATNIAHVAACPASALWERHVRPEPLGGTRNPRSAFVSTGETR